MNARYNCNQWSKKKKRSCFLKNFQRNKTVYGKWSIKAGMETSSAARLMLLRATFYYVRKQPLLRVYLGEGKPCVVFYRARHQESRNSYYFLLSRHQLSALSLSPPRLYNRREIIFPHLKNSRSVGRGEEGAWIRDLSLTLLLLFLDSSKSYTWYFPHV